MTTHAQQAVLSPETMVREFKKSGVTHIVTLPDSETNYLYELMIREPSFTVVPVAREGETMAIAAGVLIGGKTPVCLIQNTGMFESGDSIRGIAIDVGLPIVMVIGYRGYDRHGETVDTAAHFTEPILHTWGIKFYLVETDEDGPRISKAFEEAKRTSKPVAILVGDEYHGFNRPGAR
ncbi:MAG: hypothetical protein HY681_09020 [Chloroflexi bacterium]|nr:hypothetical protein [Chloroflexota bacterium]